MAAGIDGRSHQHSFVLAISREYTGLSLEQSEIRKEPEVMNQVD